MLSACGSTTKLVDPTPPAPIDVGCDRCDLLLCPDLPKLQPEAADGSAHSDSVILLSPKDGEVHNACRRVIKSCMACIQRGRDQGAIR